VDWNSSSNVWVQLSAKLKDAGVCSEGREVRRRSVTRRSRDYFATNRWLGKGCSREEQGAVTSPTGGEKKKKCYTALTRLRRNEPLASEWVQQGRTRGCHQPHFKKLERDERAEANICPSATEVTWQAMKPVNRKRPAPDGGPKANKLSKVVRGFER
jgi:hypothetical protein